MTCRAAFTLASLAIGVSSFAAPPVVGGCSIFPADNYWNTPVDTLPRHASSDTWVASVGNTARLHADWGTDLPPACESTDTCYGIPFTTVTLAQASQFITADPDPDWNYSSESDNVPFPIPSNAPIEGGAIAPDSSDRHVLVIETTNCVLYELYHAFNLPGGVWQASSWAHWPLNSNALRPADWTSADAAGLPIFPGLVRWEEVAAGEITHAIRFTANHI